MTAAKNTNTAPTTIAPTAAGSFAEAARLLSAVATDAALLAAVDAAGDRIAATFRAGGKVLVCGNGGSLCDAAHFAEELPGRFRADRPALPAIAISDAAHITCTANDYGFDRIFARGVEALGRKGDGLILLSTSGNSPNILAAAEAAKARDIWTLALLGKGGGSLKGRCDHEFILPGSTSDRIQELHMLVLHVLVERVEAGLGYAKG